MLRRVPVIALMLAGCPLAQADVFRWVDDHGVPHYSDQWVPGSEVIKTDKARPDSATMSAAAGARSPQQPRAATQLADDGNNRAVQQDVARAREANCKKAQSAYTDSVTHRRVYKTDAKGERSYMSDEELDSYRAQARKNVLEYCGSVPVIDPNAPIPEPQPVPEPKVNPADATSP
jgi:hypothetical protein